MIKNSQIAPAPPFSKEHQLCSELADSSPVETTSRVPGHPSIVLPNTDSLSTFLCNELWAADLEAAAGRLWILTTPSGRSVHSLNKQKVLGREIVVTEDPRLHLLWINNRIFIKPLPSYLTSYSFWTTALAAQPLSPLAEKSSHIRRAAIGFLRTYRLLIQHESDLVIAQRDDLRLVQSHLRWSEVSIFLADLEHIEDEHVSARYHYGEIRLSRLNLYAPLLFRRYIYEYIPMQYGEYFTRLYGPILFVFAAISTCLNTMQVALAADSGQEFLSEHVWRIFYWFSIVTLLITVVVGSFLVLLWTGTVANEWKFTLKHRQKVKGHKMS
ncbi:hypothetical protein PV08_07749 [Exophiala spinifera]|uniref:Subtilisin-like serine protease n=1 Tax=Exophiala spinifera TaxID=91928 RepID=A0A0D1ZQB3_9EURO|nr:uncharacterized protein PV08_07749 [Exophiala spinifera]KIW14962.1 hypothetical protein PV08_07749 [Exophiala spinifera]